MGRGATATLLAVLATVAAVPATAAAGDARIETVTMGAGADAFEAKVLLYDAARGERNDVRVTLGSPGTQAQVRDTAGVSPGSSCTRPDASDPTLAVCDFGRLPERQERVSQEVRLTLGDGDDRARVDGSSMPGGAYAPAGEFDGGPGDDVLVGGPGYNRFAGGDGDDSIAAGDGELFCGGGALIDEGSGSNGSDTFTGAGVVLYTRRSAPIEASLDGERNDGEAGENDEIGAALEVVGGAGDDRLSGNRSGNRLAGGAGSDTLRGGAGADVLSAAGLRLDPGFEEADALGGDRATTDDTLHGDDGDDLLTGSAGANVLVGGSGDDTLNGLGGADLLVTADRSADLLRCGPGVDRARMDGRDFFRSTTAQRCERPERSVPGVAAELGGADSLQNSEAVGYRAAVRLAVGCPGDAAARCRGRIRLVFGRRTLGSARLNIPRDQIRTIRVRMARSARRLISRRDGLTAVAVIRSRDRRGRVRETRVGGNYIRAEPPDYSGGYGDDSSCGQG